MKPIEFLLKTRVKYVAIIIIILFCFILFFTSLDHQLENEQLGAIQYRKNIVSQEAENHRRKQKQGANQQEVVNPADYQVSFISGKELAKEVDNEHKSFQVHVVKLTNMERSKINVQCNDPFSSFGKVIPPGGSFEFKVTDLFAKRHYWCTGTYGTAEYIFKAYGEGAPRDNNLITLHKEGAFIKGKRMNIEDSPMKYKFPNKGLSLRDMENDLRKRQQEGHQDRNNVNEVPFPDSRPEDEGHIKEEEDKGHAG